MPEYTIDYSVTLLVLIGLGALLTGVLHGATGMAGGVVMTALLSQLLGIKVAIPVMTCALVISHLSRVVIYWKNTAWRTARLVLLFGLPGTFLGALVFSWLSPRAVATVFALFLLSSIPVKHWARRRQLHTGPVLLAGASMVWGVLAGNVVGPGFFLAPFLQGTGLNRLGFAGTLATVTLMMNLLKAAVFGSQALLDGQLMLLGIGVGLATVPGNWLGSRLLRRSTDRHHGVMVDTLTIVLIINFVYLAMVTAS